MGGQDVAIVMPARAWGNGSLRRGAVRLAGYITPAIEFTNSSIDHLPVNAGFGLSNAAFVDCRVTKVRAEGKRRKSSIAFRQR